jgi:hypothetical protein
VQFEELVALSPAILGPPTPISTVFEPYLSIFVDAQDRIISDMVTTYRQQRGHPPPDQSDRVTHLLPSSTELFYFYRDALERCAQLSNKSPFLDLCGVFKKWLKVYSEEVLAASLK